MKDIANIKPNYLSNDQWIYWLKYCSRNMIEFAGRDFEEEKEAAIREARIAARAQAIYEDFMV